MLKNFIYAKEKSLFEEALNNGEVLDEAIVFIEDTKEIWTHGTYFGCTYTEQYKGTITGVSANGTSIATSGVANIPAASTSAYGVTKLSSSTSSTSTSLAATASAVKSAYDLANGRQEKLVSGTNIKTINGESILGSGDIVISGGSSSGSGAYSEVNHGISDTIFTLTPNTFHIWGKVSSLTLTIGSRTSGIANEYLFQFTSGSEPTTLILPDNINFNSDFTIEANKIYQISILNGFGAVMSWEFVPNIVFPIPLEIGDNGNIGILLYSYLQSTYGKPTSGTTLNEEIIIPSNGVVFSTIEYGTYEGFTGYWLDGYDEYKMSWALLEDGRLIRVIPDSGSGGAQ